MIKRISHITLLFISSLAIGQGLTLEEAISATLENNYGIKVSKINAEVADNNANKGNAGMLPTIDLRGGTNYGVDNTKQVFSGGIPPIERNGIQSSNYNASINLNYTFFDGFAMFHSYDKLKSLRELSEQQTKFVIETSLSNLITAYYEAARLQENLKVAQEVLYLSSNRLKRIESRKAFGQASTLDLLNAQVDYNSDTSLYLNNLFNLNAAKRNLNLLMAQQSDINYQIETDVDLTEIPSFESLIEETKLSNKELSIAEKNKLISNYDLKIAQAGRYPVLSLNTSYGYNQFQNEAGFALSNKTNGLDVGITATFRLFDGNKRNIQIENARLNKEVAGINYLETELEILNDLENAYANYLNALAILHLEKKNISTAEQNFQLTQQRYEMGLMNSTQLREAQLNLSNAKNRLSGSQFTAKVNETIVLSISGKLLTLNQVSP